MSNEILTDPRERWKNTSSALADFRASIQAEKEREKASKKAAISNLKNTLQTTGQLLNKSGIPAIVGTYSLLVGGVIGLASVKTAISDEAATQLIAGPLANLDKLGENFRMAGVIGYGATSLVFLKLSQLTYKDSINNFRKVLSNKK